jgi:hypothetical protein
MITHKLVQQRPNTEVPFYTPSADSLARINQYVSNGVITAAPINETSDNGLINTLTMHIVNDNDYDTLANDPVFVAEKQARNTHCANNSISYNVEEYPS